MKYLFLSTFIACICFSSCSNTQPNNTSKRSGFNRDTVYVKYFEEPTMSYWIQPSKIVRTGNTISFSVDCRFTSPEQQEAYVLHKKSVINDPKSFFSQAYATERYSHMKWSVDIDRKSGLGLMRSLEDIDVDGNTVRSDEFSGLHPQDLTDNPFTGRVWEMCYTKVKLEINKQPMNLYLDEFLMLKDSLGVSESDIISAIKVDY